MAYLLLLSAIHIVPVLPNIELIDRLTWITYPKNLKMSVIKIGKVLSVCSKMEVEIECISIFFVL